MGIEMGIEMGAETGSEMGAEMGEHAGTAEVKPIDRGGVRAVWLKTEPLCDRILIDTKQVKHISLIPK